MNADAPPTRCYIGMGSNQGDSLNTLRLALLQLAALDGVTVAAVSRFYSSKPVGPQNQPDYVNAVAALDTLLDAQTLLQGLFAVERAHGRLRDPGLRWGPRTLDLDLLLYGDSVIDAPNLSVPHPQMTRRAFVIYPLHDIAPELVLPDGSQVNQLRAELAGDDLRVCA